MKEGRWVVRKYVSGQVVERSKVYIPGSRPIRKGRVKGSTTAAKADSNAMQAVKQLARAINCNFTRKDLYITLTYAEGRLPEDWKQAEKETGNFIRRLNYQLSKQRIQRVKWISVASEADGKSGEPVRPHTHVILSSSGITFRDGDWWCGGKSLREIWGMGVVYCEPLRAQQDYTPLAVYLIRQAGRQENRKKYRTSRNLAKPIVTEEEVRTGRPLRAPAGARVVEQRYNTLDGVNYIRYIRPCSEPEGTGPGKRTGKTERAGGGGRT